MIADCPHPRPRTDQRTTGFTYLAWEPKTDEVLPKQMRRLKQKFRGKRQRLRYKPEPMYPTEFIEAGGIIPDIGAKDNVVGEYWLYRHERKFLKKHGYSIRYEKTRPESYSGIGGKAEVSLWKAYFPIRVGDGVGEFAAQVLPKSHVPALWGLRSMRQQDCITDCGNDRMIIPNGARVDIHVGAGAKVMDLEPTASGHLLMTTTNFSGKEVNDKPMILYHEGW